MRITKLEMTVSTGEVRKYSAPRSRNGPMLDMDLKSRYQLRKWRAAELDLITKRRMAILPSRTGSIPLSSEAEREEGELSAAAIRKTKTSPHPRGKKVASRPKLG